MPSLRYYFRKYVTGLEEPAEKSKIQQTVKNQNSAISGGFHVDTIQPELLRKIVLREPLTLKAVMKKNKDTIRNWFIIKAKNQKDKVPKKALKLIDDFNYRTKLPYKLYTAGVCANIYGTGFLERTFIESNSNKLDSPVKKGSKPLGLIPINSENIVEMKEHPSKKDGVLYYVYKKGLGDKDYIHPDRVISIAIDKLPHSPFGISKVDVLLNVLKSKMNADVSSGEILNWFGHGILDMTVNNMNPEQEKEMVKLFKKHPSYYIHDEDYNLDVKNPTRIDPSPFYDYFYTNIAAAFEMPTHILTGQHPGDVTGTEVGVSAYYDDISNIQSVIFTPILEKIYSNLLESNGFKWNYVVDWNPIFVDELSEANILKNRTYSSTANFSAGIIDLSEARTVLNEGVVDLDVSKKIEKPESEPVVKPTIKPNDEPQEPKKPTAKNILIHPLNDVQRKMINEMRRLGERELVEQEKRLKEAERLKKVKKDKRKK